MILRARPQVDRLIINANGDPTRFSGFALPVIADLVPGWAGPLAGVLTGLRWCERHAPATPWLLSIATDTPFFPLDLKERLAAAVEREAADLALAASFGRVHPVFGLWPVRLAAALEQAIGAGMRKIDGWTASYRTALATFDDRPDDPFFNINTAEDLATAQTRVSTDRA